jgi:hypothetical protein
MKLVKDGHLLHSLDDWIRWAPPEKGEAQWKDGRSAKEFARRWLPGLPAEVAAILDTHPATAAFVPTEGLPEHPTRLDEFGGPPKPPNVWRPAPNSPRPSRRSPGTWPI